MTRPEFKYPGAAAMAELHEREIRAFVRAWTKAKRQGCALPEADDDAYSSYDALLRHVFEAAGGYMRWICRSLGLEDPGIPDLPEQTSDQALDSYLDHMLGLWEAPLVDLDEAQFFHPNYPSSGEDLCLELMLEHAVVHPMRHRLQLEHLLAPAT